MIWFADGVDGLRLVIGSWKIMEISLPRMRTDSDMRADLEEDLGDPTRRSDEPQMEVLIALAVTPTRR